MKLTVNINNYSITAKPITWSNSPSTHGFYTAVTP